MQKVLIYYMHAFFLEKEKRYPGSSMVKKIDILGVKLDNYTVREAIRQVESYLSNDTLNTIEHISMQMLTAAEGDAISKDMINSLNLAIIGEKEILQAAGLASMQRVRETEENDFYFEFFKRLERNKKSIFLLGEATQKVEEMKKELLTSFPKLVFAGEYAVEKCVGNLEAVINEMNAGTPDVIVSILPSPMQEHFLWDHRDKISANIWYGVGNLPFHKKKHGILGYLRSLIHLGKLKNSMSKYRLNKRGNSDAEIDE